MEQQTAVEWLVEQLIPKDQHEGIMDIIEDAKQREKQQITKAFHDGMVTNSQPHMGKAEQYYHQTFKK
jgi:hypothetical protein